MASKTTERDTYRENYRRLKEIAERLSADEELDIDTLVPLVDEAMRAYQACKARIEAAERALASRLEEMEEADDDG